jgi:cystathionine beta-lyase
MKDLTRCVTIPEVSLDGYASLTVPTHRASTIVFPDVKAYANRAQRGPEGYSYGLQGTPTTRTLEAQINGLHKANGTVLLPSGQAAIAIAMLTVLQSGDEVLIPDSCYPPVKDFCRQYLGERSIGFEIYPPLVGADIESYINSKTKLIWVESPGSTTMEVQDLRAISAVARRHDIRVGCDNTWATPLLFKPLDHGADFVVEALTKYIGGHSDLLMGSISFADAAVAGAVRQTMKMLGQGVSPDEVALAQRGIQTLGVRLAHSGSVAEIFARKLSPLLPDGYVLHPGLPGTPGHEKFLRDFQGSSGVFSVLVPPAAEADVNLVLEDLCVFVIGASWGGTRSLIAPMSVKNNRVFGGHDGLILRVSIGLEAPEDLWSDLEVLVQAINRGAASADGALRQVIQS